MKRVHFLFVGEGSSDEAVVPHLENLCIWAGADEVTAAAPDLRRLPYAVGHSVGEKLQAALQLEPNVNLIFVHRDADSRDPEPRYREIADAARALGCREPHVCVVPIQEIEAWLLLDEKTIKAVAGRRDSRAVLMLPAPNAVQNLANPKKELQAVLEMASGLTGRRLARFKSDFASHRKLLMQNLPVGGHLEGVPAWIRLRADVKAALAMIKEL